MSCIINASTSAGLINTADTSGSIALQANGTTMATVSSSGFTANTYTPSTSLITSGTAVASTSGTSITFSSIPSWVKRITVMFNGVSTNGTSRMVIRIGSGSVDTSGYVTSSWNNGGATATETSGFGIQNGAASDIFNGSFSLNLISGNTWVLSGVYSITTTGAYVGISGGSRALSGTLDRVQITTVNGTDTFDAGSINILYE